MMDRPFQLRALGEIAIRCRDFEAMQQFYGHVLGLPRLRPGDRGGHRDGIAFYRFGESFGGHVAVLALFVDDAEDDTLSVGPRSSLHHLALSLSWDEQEDASAWLRQEGYEARFEDFSWTGWRGLFTRDPDGNTVELVAASPEWHIE